VTDLAWWRWRLPAPRLLSGLLGLVCVAIGLFLVVRPLASLDTLTLTIGVGLVVSGLADVVALPNRLEIRTGSRDGAPSATRPGDDPASGRAMRAANVAVAIGWVVLGVVILVWRGVGLTALVWLVGAALVVSGLARIATSVRTPRPGGERAASVLLGIASLIVGVLALAWPDVTMLVVAVGFGARTVWFGLVHLGTAVRPRRSEPSPRIRRPSLIVAVLAVVAAVAAAGVSAWIHAGRPVVDAFYAAPDSVPTDPGVLLRSEPFTRDVPDGARGWRILYTTTDALGAPRTASALVVVPDDSSPHPVIAWTHGTTGYAPPCAPSLARQPFESGALFVLDRVIDRGWALVATDYAGLGTPAPQPYLIGKGEARSELDAVRAARHLDGAALSQQTVVWGHSQGGHAALWTGEIAADYAPDVPLAGVAALAPASDLTAFAGELTSITGGSVFASYVIAAYSQTYPGRGHVSLVAAGSPAVTDLFAWTADRFAGRPASSDCGSLPG